MEQAEFICSTQFGQVPPFTEPSCFTPGCIDPNDCYGLFLAGCYGNIPGNEPLDTYCNEKCIAIYSHQSNEDCYQGCLAGQANLDCNAEMTTYKTANCPDHNCEVDFEMGCNEDTCYNNIISNNNQIIHDCTGANRKGWHVSIFFSVVGWKSSRTDLDLRDLTGSPRS